MGKTKKVGITGRFGARYGSKTRKVVREIEEKWKTPSKCPKCATKVVKRLSVGIWYCRKCGAKFTGGAYLQNTQPGLDSRRTSTRLQGSIDKIDQEKE